jgi:hypothetical protein
VHGREKPARLILGFADKLAGTVSVDVLEINGAPALVARERDRVSFILTLEADGDSVVGVFTVRNPDKLSLSHKVI